MSKLESWKTIDSRIAFESPFITVHDDKVIMPNGDEGRYGWVQAKHDSVYVVPVDEKYNTYVVEQERYTTKQITLECVAGGNGNDNFLTAAHRELLEETGLEAKQMILLSDHIQASNSATSFRHAFFIARDLEKTTDKLDPVDGILSAKKLPLVTVREMILTGEINCAQSIAAFLMTIAYLEKEGHIL